MILAQVLLLGAAMLSQPKDTAQTEATSEPTEISTDKTSQLISTCGTRRFEAIANFPVDGKMRRSKVTLCASDIETKTQWIEKLEKGADQIAAHPSLPAEAKSQLTTQLRAEAARLKVQGSELAIGAVTGSALPAQRSTSQPMRDFAVLPPLPNTPARKTPAPSASPLAGYTSLPPLPPPKLATPKPVIAASDIAMPRLSVRCAPVGDDRTQRCGLITVDDRLVIKAEEAYGRPVQLRFRRRGSSVGEDVPFATARVRAGQTAILAVPKKICSGRNRAEFTIEVIVPGASPTVLPSFGPFDTRCG